MTSSSVHEARPSVLNSPNLRKLGTLKLDKDQYLRSYIEIQRTYLAAYAKEGKSTVASWLAEAVIASSKQPAIGTELESGFGTPVLKPRALRNKSDRNAIHEHEHGQNQIRKERDLSLSLVGQSSRAASTQFMNKDTHGIQAPETHGGQGSPRPSPDMNASQRNKHKENVVPSKPTARRERDEDEHRGRLVERRERRRAKKAIVNPKPPPPVSDVSTNKENENEAHAKKKKCKKGKGVNIPAGLALLHGFSATNIGKTRLTLEPAIGVFNKGKASANTAVKSKKITKLKAQLFSEKHFLNKTKVDSQKIASDRSLTSDSGDSSSSEEEEPVASPSSRHSPRKITASQDKADSFKRHRSQGVDAPLSEEFAEAVHDQLPLAKKRKVERGQSPVWDIEREDAQLPSSSRSDHDHDEQVPSETGTKIAGTVLMDTRPFSSRWAVTMNKPDSPAREANSPRMRDPGSPLEDVQMSSVSTIDPSHSASQVACRAPTISRFFSKPFKVQEEHVTMTQHETINPSVIHDVHSAARFHLHSKDPSVDPEDPEDTVEERMCLPTWDAHVVSVSSKAAQDGFDYFPPAISPRLGAPSLLGPPSPEPSDGIWSGAVKSVINEPHLSQYGAQSSCDSPRMPSSLLDSPNIADTTKLTLSGDDYPCNWITGFPELLDEHSPDQTQCFLPNAPWSEDLLSNSGDKYLDTGLARDSNFCRADMELQTCGTDSGLVDEYVEMDCVGGDAYYESVPVVSRNSVSVAEDEDEDTTYRRHRKVMFSDHVMYYVDADDNIDVVTESVPPWEAPTIIEDYESGECQYNDCVAAESAFPGTDPDSHAVAVQDLSSWPEKENGEEDEEDAESEESDIDQEGHSVLGSLQRFSQGRALLMGMDLEIGIGTVAGRRFGVSTVEEDVVRNLQGHWKPQRF